MRLFSEVLLGVKTYLVWDSSYRVGGTPVPGVRVWIMAYLSHNLGEDDAQHTFDDNGSNLQYELIYPALAVPPRPRAGHCL